MTQELPPADELNKSRDHESIEYLATNEYLCPHCDPPVGPNAELLATTIDWAPGFSEPYGRCRACGQHYVEGEVRP